MSFSVVLFQVMVSFEFVIRSLGLFSSYKSLTVESTYHEQMKCAEALMVENMLHETQAMHIHFVAFFLKILTYKMCDIFYYCQLLI